MALVSSLVTGFAAVAVLLGPAAAQTCPTLTSNIPAPRLATGYGARLFMTGLRVPRSLQFDTEGNLLIVEQGGTGVRWVKLTDHGGLDVCVGEQKVLIPNGLLNHGIALSTDGRTLYVSSSVDVFAYPYDPVAGTVGTPRTLITGMRQGGFHQSRTLLVPATAPNLLLVSRGSIDNVDGPTAQVESGRSMVKYWDVTTLPSQPVDYSSTGVVLGWGLRNSVGVGENPVTGEIWTVENSVDDMFRNGRDIHNDNPGEELNFHGAINDTLNNPVMGANYGYPHCYAVWETSTITGLDSVQVGMQIIQNTPQGGITDAFCASDTVSPRLTFPSHTAPLDVKFRPNGTAAYISFHGSWNRSPPDGYRLSRVDFGPDGQPVEPATSATRQIPVMWNENNSACPNRCFRPVGLAWDEAGRLFMASDTTGEVYVITGA